MTDHANTSDNPRKILVTSALPYANGSIHLGHMVEHIQTDIWVRYQKHRGNVCHYICADDAHGTPIMLSAEKEGISPEALIERTHKEHHADFQDFLIGHDNFYSTHSEENRAFSADIYNKLKAAGAIKTKIIKQAYDPSKNMYLPDRFVKGECPKCHAADQYGDNCENCGATYDPTELINPYSIVSGQTPIEKDSEQYFFDLPQYSDFLEEWLAAGHVQPEIANKMREWFEDGLHPWDISRNAPYWGFKIPGTDDKYFYVWLDAPIGYMASFKNYCDQHNINFDEYWRQDSATELHHFIGKDIARFHTLFWPAMLYGAGYRTPTAVHCHGFVTVNGEKMSKSRGTFIQARNYLNHLSPEYLRYFFATRLSNTVEDIDLNLEEFRQKVNSDIVGKVINIASRCAGFIRKKYDNQLAAKMDNPALFEQSLTVSTSVAALYENRQFSAAMREIMALADQVNQYIDEKKPWQMAKDEQLTEATHEVCTTGINLFKQLILMLTPVLPEVAKSSQTFLNMAQWSWDSLEQPLLSHEIIPFKPLLTRVEPEKIEAIIQAGKAEETQKANPEAAQQSKLPPTSAQKTEVTNTQADEYISIEDFQKIQLKTARIVSAEPVPEADKLLKLIVDAGEENTRQIFAGIKAHVDPDALVGKNVVIVANLAPRKMRFGLSEGMMLCAADGESLFTVHPADAAKPGMPVR